MKRILFIMSALVLVVYTELAYAQEQITEFIKDSYAPKYGAWTSSKMWGGGYVQNVIPCPSDSNRYYAYIDIGGVYRSDDQGNTWRMLHGALPTGSAFNVRGVSVDPRNADNIIVACGKYYNKAGIYISRDGGTSFSQKTIIAFDGNGMFRMTGKVIDRNIQTPDMIVVGSLLDGIWSSFDNGETWSCIGLKNVWPSDIKFDRTNRQTIWVCSPEPTRSVYGRVMGKHIPRKYESGLFRTDNLGVTWNRIHEESPLEILQDPDAPERLLGIFEEKHIRLSLDGGYTWEDFSSGLPEPKKLSDHPLPTCNPNRFCSLAAGPGFILTADTKGNFYRLDKGASTWVALARPKIDLNGWAYTQKDHKLKTWRFGWALGSIVIDPENPEHWYFTDWYAVWQTSDSGGTWKATVQGMAQTFVFDILADAFDEKTVYLGMADNGPFRSPDGGESFEQYEMVCDMKCMAQDAQDRSILYGCRGKHSCSLKISHDSGETWQDMGCKDMPDMGKNKAAVYTLAAHPKISGKIYACVSGVPGKGGGGVYESSNYGENWTWKGAGLPVKAKCFFKQKGFFAQTIWPAGREIACSNDGSLVCHSMVTGKVAYLDASTNTWKESFQLPMIKDLEDGGFPSFDIAADPFSERRFFLAAGAAGLVITEDGGRSWKRWVLTKKCGRVVFDAKVKGRVAVSTVDGIALSLDGGRVWQMLDPAIPSKAYWNPLAFQGNHLVVGTSQSGSFWIDIQIPTDKASRQ